jgi:hypothetical protein
MFDPVRGYGGLVGLSGAEVANRAQAAADAQGFRLWTKGDYNLNVIGIRNPDDQAALDAFNDAMLWLWRVAGEWQFAVFKITMDPGQPSVKSPRRTDGTARLIAPQQISRLWVQGNHHASDPKKAYRAGVQSAAPENIRVWRVKGDLDAGAEFRNVRGINYHRANRDAVSTVVGAWSEGCQVNCNPKHFEYSLMLWDLQVKSWGEGGKYLSYTLYEADTAHPLYPVLRATL